MDRAVALRRLLKSESIVACKVAVRRGRCCERQEISSALKNRRRGSPALWHETKSTHYNGPRRHCVQAETDAPKNAGRGNGRRSGEELTGKRPEAAGASRVFLPVLSSAQSDEIEPPPPPSCPSPDLIRGLSRASTPCLRQISKQGVDGRDKPGHDSGEVVQNDQNRLYFCAAAAKSMIAFGVATIASLTFWISTPGVGSSSAPALSACMMNSGSLAISSNACRKAAIRSAGTALWTRRARPIVDALLTNSATSLCLASSSNSCISGMSGNSLCRFRPD